MAAQAVWESLAIMEYLAELFPEKHLWPKALAARAMARAVSNEMHAGFGALRNACPMNIRRPRKPVPMSDAVLKDVARIEHLWRECRAKFGKGGKFLFGKFSIADAMYTPVVSRFETYAIPVADDTRAYMDTIMNTEAFPVLARGGAEGNLDRSLGRSGLEISLRTARTLRRCDADQQADGDHQRLARGDLQQPSGEEGRGQAADDQARDRREMVA